MRRGQPLRRTPLAPGKPLERRTPMPRGTTQLRSTQPVRPVSDKRRTDNAKRAVVVSAMREACAGRCARCGRADMPVRGHERLARAHGGNIIQPDALLDDLCNSWAEDHPQVAAWTGWKVSSKWPHSPDLEPWQAWALDGTVVDFTVPDEAVA